MYREVYDELAKAAEENRRQARIGRLLARASEELTEAERQRESLGERVAKEERDVEKVEGVSLTALLGRVVGQLEDWKEKEIAEAVQARADYEAARSEVEQLREQVAELREAFDRLGDSEAEYKRIFREKAQSIIQHGGESADRVAELAREVANTRSLVREIDEAIAAGQATVRCVEAVAAGIPEHNKTTTFMQVGAVPIPVTSDAKLSAKVEAGLRYAQQWALRFERELVDLEPWTGDDASVLPSARLLRHYAQDLSRPSVKGEALERTRAAVAATRHRVDELLSWLGESRRSAVQRHERVEASYVEQVTFG